MNILNLMELARRNAITASELCQIRNEAALSFTSYVTLFAWLFIYITNQYGIIYAVIYENNSSLYKD